MPAKKQTLVTRKSGPVTLGKKYTDLVHNITGIATARTEYLSGCSHVCLEWMSGKEVKCRWFDEPHLKGVKVLQPEPGGPGLHPPSLND